MTTSGRLIVAALVALWLATGIVVAGWDEPCTASWDRCQ